MSSYTTRLRRELDSLKAERRFAEMANDFAYTDGTIAALDREIGRIRELIREAEEAHGEGLKQAA